MLFFILKKRAVHDILSFSSYSSALLIINRISLIYSKVPKILSIFVISSIFNLDFFILCYSKSSDGSFYIIISRRQIAKEYISALAEYSFLF